ncbi:fimbrial protein (plasmid) [Serratia sp. JSRIV001]|uniref:fimbrial protein n=1 Tax=unclassified Serratia (in: enterobacteria) TaxID=2647522 RepID=UPI001CBC6309|nr:MULTISPECIES: fimbrial protein [unclassified Serratia (in: enterobacteria)]UAN45221.1 fimbrial protein [Serratia sp. JSRIV001]UAN48825.1 fimbrial protein [Serratia sp. JSRIV001]UAN50695.1 fimbrial protein [Serratia sp. JSRIV002]UAN54543.1 fimbrial protein [Serratia sp. JSRIV002]UAN56642.1 fimbrial protein [Serratia sp. JSRIV004]
MKRPLAVATWLAGTLFTGVAGAVDVSITGNLVESLPCKINNDDPIDVDFGDDLIINKIDGTAYSVTISYNVACADTTGNVRLSFQGRAAAFDATAVETSRAGLGIRLLLGGRVLAINSTAGTVINPAALPVLSAVPVVNGGAGQEPTDGPFTATATLLASYD